MKSQDELGVIKSPAIRKAVNGLRLMFVVSTLVILVAILAVAGMAHRAQVAAEYARSEIVLLKATVVAMEVERLQSEIDDLKPPGQEPAGNEDTAVGPTYKVEVTNFGATTRGKEAFTIRLEAIPDMNGPYTLEEARDQIERVAYADHGSIVELCNTNGREFSHYSLDDGVGRQLQSLDGSEPLEGGCWVLLESLSGEAPSQNLPTDAVKALQDLAGHGVGPAMHRTLLVDETGWIIGRWNGDFPKNASCLERSMEAVGWEGEKYFPIDPHNHDVFRVLYDEAFTSWLDWVPLIPDLCESANLHPVEQPDWLEYRYSDDAHVVTTGSSMAGSLEVQIHTDPKTCTDYPDQWREGFLVEVNDEAIATVLPHDLVLIETGFGDLGQMVYVRPLPGGTLGWLEPAGEGPESTSFQDVPAIWANPNIDGIMPWVSFGGASLYIVGNEVFVQSPPDPVEIEPKPTSVVEPTPTSTPTATPTSKPTATPTLVPTRESEKPPVSLEKAPFDKVSKVEAPADFLTVGASNLVISGRGDVPLATCGDGDPTVIEDVLQRQGEIAIVVWLWDGFAHSYEMIGGDLLWAACEEWRPPAE